MKHALPLLLLLLGLAGCAQDPYANDPYALDPNAIKFLDHVESNSTWDGEFSQLEFTTRDKQTLSLKDVAPGKSLILVMTRGYTGSICPYCSTQVSRLIANYGEFTKRNAEVIVVYPLKESGDTDQSQAFVNRAYSLLPPGSKREVPFPLVMDLELKAVDALGIRRDLSKPATYILDADRRLQFSYVGNTLADRPSVQALLEQLDKINKQAAGS